MAKTTTIAGNTFLFTGKLTEFTREDAEAHVEAEGGKVLSGVSAKLNYLVVGEDAGSKLAKAEALGTVTILHEKEFLKMMNSGKSNGSDPSKQNLTKKKIFKAKNILDAKTAKLSISEFADLDAYDSIDPKAATILAAEDSMLLLNGIKYLDVDSAKALAKHKGKNDLIMDGLEEMEQNIAREIAKHKGALSLNSIRNLTVDTLAEFKDFKFNISLNALEQLEDASYFINHTGTLSLLGLISISDKVAEQLSKKKGFLALGINSTEVSDNVLTYLVGCCPKFNNINSLNAKQSKIIAKYTDGISLNGLKNLDLNLANELIKVGSELELGGIDKISDDVAKVLSNYKGRLVLGCKTLSEKSAQYLGEIKRNQEKNSLSLPNIDWSKVEGAGLDFFFIKGIWSTNNLKAGIELGEFSSSFFSDYPKINFNVERVVKICYALAGGADYGLDLDETWFEEAVADGEEFQTFLEIGKMSQTGEWEAFFPKRLKSDLKFYTQLAESCVKLPIEFIKLADDKIKSNRDIMLRFLKLDQGDSILKLLPSKLQGDKEFVFKPNQSKKKPSYKGVNDPLKEDIRIILANLPNISFLDEDEFLDEHRNINNLRLLIEIQRIANEGKSDDLLCDTERFNKDGWLPESDNE